MVGTKADKLQWDDLKKGSRKGSQSGMRSSRHSVSHRRNSRRVSAEGARPHNVLDAGTGGSMTNINPVLAENGKDVTPKALFTGGLHEKAEQIQLEDATAASDFKSLASMLQTGIGTGTGAYTGTGIFGRSVVGSGIRNSVRSMSILQQSAIMDEEEAEKIAQENSRQELNTAPEPVQQLTSELTEEQMQMATSIELKESETDLILRIYGTAICEATDNIDAIKEINNEYLALCESRLGNDKYAERGMQTFNNHLKHKEAATNPMNTVDVGCDVSDCTLWDAFNANDDGLSKASSRELTVQPKEGDRRKSLSETIASEASGEGDTITSQTRAIAKREPVFKEENEELKHNEILQSDEMAASLVLVERVLTQNIYQRNIGAYRGLAELDAGGNAVPPALGKPEQKLSQLWTYNTARCKGYTVTCIAWNRINPDIIAISYGYNAKHNSIDATDSNAGVVCCWNIKNLEHPERIYNLPSSATCCDFSQANPNLLAVGLYNGGVVIYNVIRKGNIVILDSMDSVAKHLGPVWSVRWTERERGTDERGEVLISTSADGRVVQWTIRKGFESLVLMKVKRVGDKKRSGAAKKDTARKTESARISQFAPTTSFDFHPSDGNSYLIGTEEGAIHRCSCSYNEQTLDSWNKGHAGPVYSVKWHPKVENVFLTCSEDWTIQIWHQKHPTAVISLQSGQRPIKHVEWSPYNSTIFVAITDVSIDVWDVTASILDPVISTPFRTELSWLSFSPTSNCVLVGDTNGAVNVYQICGFPQKSNEIEALTHLIQASVTSH